jgi:hypothetical protein
MNELLEKLKAHLKMERDSKETYDSFISRIDNADIKNGISAIRNDEIEHIKIVEEMISIVENYSNSITVRGGIRHGINLKGFITDFNSLMVTSDVENYPDTILDIIKDMELQCVYISFNKIPKYIKNLIKKDGLNLKNIKFISCVKSAGDDIIVSPENLTGLSIELEKQISKISGKFFVIFDTLSAFTVYHSKDIIMQFVGSINSKVETHNAGVVWIAINEEGEKEIINKAGPLCDRVIKS